MVWTPPRCANHIASSLPHLANRGHSHLAMRNRSGEVFDRRPGGTFHRDARDASGMGCRSPLDVFGTVTTAAYHQSIIG
jgi:hypothetical protein